MLRTGPLTNLRNEVLDCSLGEGIELSRPALTAGRPVFPLAERRTSIERRQHWKYRFQERRSAFDRRRTYLVVGALRDDPQLLAAVLLATNGMSLLDGLLTAVELEHGIAHELNPLLAPLFAAHPYLAVALKLCLLLAVTACIWRWRRYRLVLTASLLALGVFSAVIVYHLESLRNLGLI